MTYRPKKVFFEEKSLDYPLGKKLKQLFEKEKVEIEVLTKNRVTNIKGKTPTEKFVEGKNTLVVRVRKALDFQSCKPSAHYQLPLISGCAGKCEYCYLNTRFGKKPYITIYANIEEILDRAKDYIGQRTPKVTYFEAAATSDPIPLEKYTGSLASAVKFIGNEEYGRLRFVTKFSEIDSLLNIEHNGHTTIRFSVNSYKIIKDYEHGTASLNARIEAAKKVLDHGYPLGFIIGPVILYDNWKEDYLYMLKAIKNELGEKSDAKINFEIISHRFTKTAKNKILEVFPKTTLPMSEQERIFKYGQFGYGKYVYGKEELEDIKNFFIYNLKEFFTNCEIDYVI